MIMDFNINNKTIRALSLSHLWHLSIYSVISLYTILCIFLYYYIGTLIFLCVTSVATTISNNTPLSVMVNIDVINN